MIVGTRDQPEIFVISLSPATACFVRRGAGLVVVVKPRLEKVDGIAGDPINDPMFARETARPVSRRAFQRLRLADSQEGGAERLLHDPERTVRDLWIDAEPVAQILQELVFQERASSREGIGGRRWLPITLRQVPTRRAEPRR